MFSSRPSLSACILESLRRGEMSAEFARALLNDSRTYVVHKDETMYWDYKETIDLENPIEVAKLAKRVLGFHNAKGGVLVYGVADNYVVKGIYSKQIVDTAVLRNKIKKYTGERIDLFQAQLKSSSPDRLVWLVFIPPRKGPPLPVAADGPHIKGKPIIQKNQYYVRVHDEVRLCVDPSDYERLFSGMSFKHLHAYLYEIDQPFYRLLAPHHEEFIGRNELIDKICEALDSRSYIIALDGVGGVGKSALAIELIRRLYRANKYQFIVSVSAKNRVWQGHTAARQAGFSGFIELLHEIAKVLEIDSVGRSIDDVKSDTVETMKGTEGLLLIDNIEEIYDSAVFDFLQNEIPDPVKVLVTSRISRALGARTISVPEMNEDEAVSLLQHELERVGYYGYIAENNEIREIVQATGRLPLALKWAASLASNVSSLRQVSSRLRSYDTTKREFLNFCFTTMFDELSEIARDVALLCPYLGNDWNVLTLSIALAQPPEEIEKAIVELKERGILLASMPTRDGAFSVLPLTMDFLSHKWHQHRGLRDAVTERISNAVASENYQGNIFNWPLEERIAVLFTKAIELEKRYEYSESLKFVKLALQWSTELDINNINVLRLRFTEGRIIYKASDKRDGIARMQSALDQAANLEGYFDEEHIFLAQAVLFHGRSQEEEEALERIVSHIAHASTVTDVLIEEFCKKVLRQGKYHLLSDLMDKAGARYAYWVVKAVSEYLHDQQLIYTLGTPLLKVLKQAAKSTDASPQERREFLRKARSLEAKFGDNITN
jgi:hypothetical protein